MSSDKERVGYCGRVVTLATRLLSVSDCVRVSLGHADSCLECETTALRCVVCELTMVLEVGQ